MQPAKTLLLLTGTLALACCSLLIDAQLDEKGTSTGSGGAGGATGASSGGSTSTATATATATATSTAATTTAGVTTTTTTAAQGASSSSGGCGADCALDNATAECVDGVCAIKGCDNKFDDCDKIASNGCETNLNTTLDHCGSCGHACNSMNSCKGGKCH